MKDSEISWRLRSVNRSPADRLFSGKHPYSVPVFSNIISIYFTSTLHLRGLGKKRLSDPGEEEELKAAGEITKIAAVREAQELI